MSEERTAIPNPSFLINFLIGGCSGAVAKTVTAPLDRIKILFQTQDGHPKIRSGEVPRYTSIISTASRIYQEQGLRAFWRGNLVDICRFFPTEAVILSLSDVVRSFMPRYDPIADLSKVFAVNAASGIIAGLGCLAVVYPLDLARIRLAADVGSGKRDVNGVLDCFSKTIAGPRGIRGLYVGFGISYLSLIPNSAVYIGCYETFRQLNPWKENAGASGFISRLTVAHFVGILAVLAAYPFTTVVARLQMQVEKPIHRWPYKGLFQCTKHIAREEGIAAFWKGAGVNAARSFVMAWTLVAYDYFQTSREQFAQQYEYF